MAETIEDVGGGAKWHWYNVMHDLKEQGGLEGVVINPSSVDDHGCGGDHNGNRFYITWVYNRFLLVTMQQFSQPLVDAFARVVEYKPFCCYGRNSLVTVEWDKTNPVHRFEELLSDSDVSNVVELKAFT